ncbi:acyl-CoA N-acyltransferase [Cubamyces lactineus]|nr:acyl-CoA N-acyltransferase [Cubamyces lactineus]
MSAVQVQQVLKPSDELIESAISLLLSATKDDTYIQVACGDDPSTRGALARMMILEGVYWGEFWTATEDDELVGFLTWTPPHSEPAIPKDERAKVVGPFMQALSEERRKYMTELFSGEFPGFVAQCLGPTGKHDGWWLRIAMVRPDKQGQGIARKLLEPMRRKAAERGEHIACSTTAHRNVAIYKALGFDLRGSRTFPSPWGDWELWVLYQKP